MVSPVEVVVQEVVVKLQHTQLGLLIHNDADLKGSIYRDLVFAGFDLVRVADLSEIFQPDRTQMLVDNVFVFSVQHFCLTLNGFDKLAVGTVTQKLVHFRKQGFFCFNVNLSFACWLLFARTCLKIFRGM